MTVRASRFTLLPLGAAIVATSCLPADDRPPPGSLELTVSPSPAVLDGIATADGWKLTFRRVVAGIGRTSLGDGCVSYAEARYDRVVDVTQGAGQKLSVLYGLGSCDVQFQMAPPSSDSVLGAGVTEDDRTLMRTPGTDAYVPDAGITLIVQGSAEKQGVTKKFDWAFRQRYRYENCGVTLGGATQAGVSLAGNDAVGYDIAIAAERLFRDDLAETATLRFELLAQADSVTGDGDGSVALDELANVPIEQARKTAPYGVADQDPMNTVKTLRDYVYLVLFPRIPRFRDDGACTPSVGGGRHHD